MRTKKSQVAVEYLVVLGIALALLIPTVYFFYNTTSTASQSMDAQQIGRIGYEIIANAESVYAMGEPSWVTMDIRLPDSFITGIIVDEKELVLTFRRSGRRSDITILSTVPIVTETEYSCGDGHTCFSTNLHSGLNKIKLIVEDKKVKIES